jgi:hypothetical protein
MEERAADYWHHYMQRAEEVEGYLFSVERDFASELNGCKVSERLHEQFHDHGKILTSEASVEVKQTGSNWTIVDADKKYFIRNENRMLNVYIGNDLVQYKGRPERKYVTATNAARLLYAFVLWLWLVYLDVACGGLLVQLLRLRPLGGIGIFLSAIVVLFLMEVGICFSAVVILVYVYQVVRYIRK